MTLILGATSVLLTVVLSGGLVLITDASALDERAQIAADAAALAAVAEVAPGGSGRIADLADAYAELNGARIVECICSASASAVQVTVAIDDVTARARAEFDPTLLHPVVPDRVRSSRS